MKKGKACGGLINRCRHLERRERGATRFIEVFFHGITAISPFTARSSHRRKAPLFCRGTRIAITVKADPLQKIGHDQKPSAADKLRKDHRDLAIVGCACIGFIAVIPDYERKPLAASGHWEIHLVYGEARSWGRAKIYRHLALECKTRNARRSYIISEIANMIPVADDKDHRADCEEDEGDAGKHYPQHAHRPAKLLQTPQHQQEAGDNKQEQLRFLIKHVVEAGAPTTGQDFSARPHRMPPMATGDNRRLDILDAGETKRGDKNVHLPCLLRIL